CLRLLSTLGLVNAAGLFRERVSRQRIGASPRPATNLAEFTPAALAFEFGGVPQVLEQRRIAIDLPQRLELDIAARDRQEAAWIHLSTMGDEHEALPVVDPLGRTPDAVRGTHA